MAERTMAQALNAALRDFPDLHSLALDALLLRLADVPVK